MEYQELLDSKIIRTKSIGIEVALKDINKKLFPFQRDVTRWACKKGRAAVFLDTGLGKTFIQLEWARLMGERTLIVAPLSVARQTVREAKKIKIDVKYVRHQSEVDDHQIYITNYEMLDEFDSAQFGAVVLDESSILKSLNGKTRRSEITEFMRRAIGFELKETYFRQSVKNLEMVDADIVHEPTLFDALEADARGSLML